MDVASQVMNFDKVIGKCLNTTTKFLNGPCYQNIKVYHIRSKCKVLLALFTHQ